ncbi:MAG: MFS transporter [Gammaproteobacteria bacterium]|nr:MAG: MFS transporter [Gammaproteobacteria bacterium]
MKSLTSTQHNRSLVTGLTFVATLGGLLFGYDTAVISGAVSAIDANFIEPLNLSETARSSLSGWTVSSALFGCIIGAVIAGWLAKRLGRKGGLLVAGALFLLSAVGSAYPELGIGPIGGIGPRALTPFIFYRILCGVGVGIASMLSPLYIAEIAPSQIRGRLVSFNQLSASEAVPAALFAGLLLCVPDTPRWLVMQGRSAQALQILIRLLGHGAAQATVADIEASFRVQTDRVAPSLFAFGSRVVVAGITLSVFQQFVGINAVLYYAPLMFKNMGATTDTALWQTIIVGLANALSTIIAILTVDRWGRKPLLIVGALVMAVAMLALGFLFQARLVGVGALCAVVIYSAGFALSWGPVTWVLLSEMFPNAIKNRALAIAVAAQWIANLFVSWSFKVLDGNSVLNDLFNHGFAYWI